MIKNKKILVTGTTSGLGKSIVKYFSKEKFTEIPFFKTDSNYFKVPAAWLIDKCGFKKINDKNVGVYKNQPLVVINLGNASGNEIINFAKRIKGSVFNEFDIELEEEVIVM